MGRVRRNRRRHDRARRAPPRRWDHEDACSTACGSISRSRAATSGAASRSRGRGRAIEGVAAAFVHGVLDVRVHRRRVRRGKTEHARPARAKKALASITRVFPIVRGFDDEETNRDPRRRPRCALGGVRAHEQPGWQDRYEITVYQMGWRLGGKGASGRNAKSRSASRSTASTVSGASTTTRFCDDARLLRRARGQAGILRRASTATSAHGFRRARLRALHGDARRSRPSLSDELSEERPRAGRAEAVGRRRVEPRPPHHRRGEGHPRAEPGREGAVRDHRRRGALAAREREAAVDERRRARHVPCAQAARRRDRSPEEARRGRDAGRRLSPRGPHRRDQGHPLRAQGNARRRRAAAARRLHALRSVGHRRVARTSWRFARAVQFAGRPRSLQLVVLLPRRRRETEPRRRRLPARLVLDGPRIQGLVHVEDARRDGRHDLRAALARPS